MINNNMKKRISSKQRFKESLNFTSNSIICMYKNGKKNIAFTTSIYNNRLSHGVINNVEKSLKSKNIEVKVMLPEPGCDENCKTYNQTIENKNYLTIICLPPINLFSYALEIAKVCDAIISIERYGCTKYSDFENLLYCVKENKLNINGIIACE